MPQLAPDSDEEEEDAGPGVYVTTSRRARRGRRARHETVPAAAELAQHPGTRPTNHATSGRTQAQTTAPTPANENTHGTPFVCSCGPLDEVDIAEVFRTRCLVLQSAPRFFKGSLRNALRLTLEAVKESRGQGQVHTRAWKAFLLVPRLLLHREQGQAKLTKETLHTRYADFQAGRWRRLLQDAASARTTTRQTNEPRAPPTQQQQERNRAERTNALVHLGELSAARQALTSATLAPRTPQTLAELRNPERRPQVPQVPLSAEVLHFQPTEAVRLKRQLFVQNFSRAKKGSAPGPSGSTAEHYKTVLDDELCTEFLADAAADLAQAKVPPRVARALGLGRMVSLRKPDGRVRGIVGGDFFRRLVARTLAQQFGTQFHEACSPWQYVLTTRAGTECVAHALTAETQVDARTTVPSIDGISAFDSMSRRSMLVGLANVPEASATLPFVRLFYGQPSEYLWYDSSGATHVVTQAEGGEQGDPLMPALYALGQHPALEAVRPQLLPGEPLFAFLDDVYVLCKPERTRHLFDALATALWEHSRVRVNLGKTRCCNAAGEEPPNCRQLGTEDEPCWVGESTGRWRQTGRASNSSERRWALQSTSPENYRRQDKSTTNS
jgi:hypothetical protein